MVQESGVPIGAKEGLWDRLDQLLERSSERLNPILVKEARQALKSKQFLVTFSLLLICGWGWSLIGIAILSPAVYYAPSGPFMLIGFYFVLTVPLLLIVPFTAYRSLASEREDGTYELLSISTLTARQIVTGKLGSAILQMIVYYSALSPCIAFTYLLRGVDIITIMLVLFYTFLASILLSSIGLMVATVTNARHVQVLLSVVLLLALVAATITWCVWITIAVYEHASIPYDEADLWIGQLAVVSGYVTYVALIILAASAQLSFASDNRSTKLRIVMLIQQAVFLGWMMFYWIRETEDEILFILLVFSGIHWAIMGALMIGEYAQLSPRVKRSLPMSFLGRALFTWFNPGSGTGYLFAVVNLFSVTVLTLGVAVFANIVGLNNRAVPPFTDLLLFSLLLCSYVAIYLGIGRLITILLRQYLYFGLLLPFLLTVIMVILGAVLPLFLQAWMVGFNSLDYSLLQATNWAWTLVEAVDGDLLVKAFPVPILIVLAAGAVFLVNLGVAAKEVEETRAATPQRVVEDELELHPQLAVVEEKPKSPWDDE